MPGVVKGSKQERMVVVPYRPQRRVLLVLAMVVFTAVAGGGGYLLGSQRFMQEQQSTQATLQQMSLRVDELQIENSDLRRQVAILDRSSVMDQRANEEVQNTIRSLRDRVAQLEQDIVHYRQVVSEETGETGLVISQLDIDATSDPDRYNYKLMMRQLDADGDTFLTGFVNVNLVGSQGDEQVILPLREISETEDELDIRLRFKFFQNIEGQLTLPSEFVPERVQIAAVSTEPVEKSINQNFSWVVEGE